jgi:hypothetical protein
MALPSTMSEEGEEDEEEEVRREGGREGGVLYICLDT